MHTIVCGAGYTGSRVLGGLPADAAMGIGRPAVDLDDPATNLPALPRTFAVLYTVPPASDSENDRRLECLLSKLPTPPARFVYLSTSGVYGDRRGGRVSEADEPSPSTARARRRLAAESYLAEWCAGKNCDLVILRVSGIYGPGRLGLKRIAGGAPVIRESEAPPGNRIHVDDLAACCLSALAASSPPGIYNVGDGDHRSGSSFTRTAARLAGLEAPAEISMAEAETNFADARLSFLRESRRLDTAKMRDVLGFTPRYCDPEDGIRASLESA